MRYRHCGFLFLDDIGAVHDDTNIQQTMPLMTILAIAVLSIPL